MQEKINDYDLKKIVEWYEERLKKEKKNSEEYEYWRIGLEYWKRVQK